MFAATGSADLFGQLLEQSIFAALLGFLLWWLLRDLLAQQRAGFRVMRIESATLATTLNSLVSTLNTFQMQFAMHDARVFGINPALPDDPEARAQIAEQHFAKLLELLEEQKKKSDTVHERLSKYLDELMTAELDTKK